MVISPFFIKQYNRLTSLEPLIFIIIGIIASNIFSLEFGFPKSLILLFALLIISLKIDKYVIKIAWFTVGIALFSNSLDKLNSSIETINQKFDSSKVYSYSFYNAPTYENYKGYHQKVKIDEYNQIVEIIIKSPILVGEKVTAKGLLLVEDIILPWDIEKSNYFGYLGISATIKINDKSINREIHNKYKNRLYKTVLSHIDSLKGYYHTIYYALFIGEQYKVSEEIEYTLTRVGMRHFMAISGMHISAIFAVLFVFANFIFPWRFRVFAIMVITFGITTIIGHSPSIYRVLIMGTIIAFSSIIGKKAISLNTLFITALIYLFLFPAHLFTIGFQFSFISVLAILISIHFINSLHLAGFRKWLFFFILPSLSASTSTIPIQLYHFGEFTFWAIPFNILALPLLVFSFMTFLLSFIPIPYISPLLVFVSTEIMDKSLLFFEKIIILKDLEMHGDYPNILLLIGILSLLTIFIFRKNIRVKVALYIILGTATMYLLLPQTKSELIVNNKNIFLYDSKSKLLFIDNHNFNYYGRIGVYLKSKYPKRVIGKIVLGEKSIENSDLKLFLENEYQELYKKVEFLKSSDTLIMGGRSFYNRELIISDKRIYFLETDTLYFEY